MQCRHPMLADVDVATRVNVHMPWVDRTEATDGHVAPGGARIVLLRCGSVNPVTGLWGGESCCVQGVGWDVMVGVTVGSSGLHMSGALFVCCGPRGAGAFLPRPFGERVGVRGGCSPNRFISAVIPANPTKGGKGRRRFSTAEWLVIQFRRWSAFASCLIAIWPLTQRAFRPPAGGRVTFLLLAQKKSNPKKMAVEPTPAAFRWDKPERLRNRVA